LVSVGLNHLIETKRVRKDCTLSAGGRGEGDRRQQNLAFPEGSSSSRGNSPSALHSYSKRRFIRPFAPPCSLFTFSSVVVSWLESGGQWEGESWEKAGARRKSVGVDLRSLMSNFFFIIVLYK